MDGNLPSATTECGRTDAEQLGPYPDIVGESLQDLLEQDRLGSGVEVALTETGGPGQPGESLSDAIPVLHPCRQSGVPLIESRAQPSAEGAFGHSHEGCRITYGLVGGNGRFEE